MSASLGYLIWDDEYGVYETFANLVSLNPSVFDK